MIFTQKNPPPGYYVYLYLREDGTPYYCGKGKGRRAWSKDHNVTAPRDQSRIIFPAYNLLELWALGLERKFIRWYGRKDIETGILRNQTDGGDGTSGKVWSTHSKNKVATAKTKWHVTHDTSGANNSNYGTRWNNDQREVARIRAEEQGFIGGRKGTDPWNKGITTGPRGPNKNPTKKTACPCCGMVVANHILARFHGDKCKLNITL